MFLLPNGEVSKKLCQAARLQLAALRFKKHSFLGGFGKKFFEIPVKRLRNGEKRGIIEILNNSDDEY